MPSLALLPFLLPALSSASRIRAPPSLGYGSTTIGPYQLTPEFTLPAFTLTTTLQLAQINDDASDHQLEPLKLNETPNIQLTIPTIVNYNIFVQDNPRYLSQPHSSHNPDTDDTDDEDDEDEDDEDDEDEDDEDEDDYVEDDDEWEGLEEIFEALDLTQLLQELDLIDASDDLWLTDESTTTDWDEWFDWGWISSTSSLFSISKLFDHDIGTTTSYTPTTDSSRDESEFGSTSLSLIAATDSASFSPTTTDSDFAARGTSTTNESFSAALSSSIDLYSDESVSSDATSTTTMPISGEFLTSSGRVDTSDTTTDETTSFDSSSDLSTSQSSSGQEATTLMDMSGSGGMTSSPTFPSTTESSTAEADSLEAVTSSDSSTDGFTTAEDSPTAMDFDSSESLTSSTTTLTDNSSVEATSVEADSSSSVGDPSTYEQSSAAESSTVMDVSSSEDVTSSLAVSSDTERSMDERTSSEVGSPSTGETITEWTSGENSSTEVDLTSSGTEGSSQSMITSPSGMASSPIEITSTPDEMTTRESTSPDGQTTSDESLTTSTESLTTSTESLTTSTESLTTSTESLTTSTESSTTSTESLTTDVDGTASTSGDGLQSEAVTSSSGNSESSASVRALSSVAATEPLSWLPVIDMHTLMPLEALVMEGDLSLLGGAVKANEKYEVLRKVGMTIFAPVNSAFDGIPMDIEALTAVESLKEPRSGSDANRDLGGDRRLRQRSNVFPRRDPDVPPRRRLGRANHFSGSGRVADCEAGSACAESAANVNEIVHLQMPQARAVEQKDVLADFEKLIMFHVVRRVVPPGMIEARKSLSLKSEMRGRSLTVELLEDVNGLPEVRVNGRAKILAIVKCRNGFIYKVDQPLFPAFNLDQPTLVDAIRTNKHFSKLRYLVEESGIFNDWAAAGPITMLLIPDEAWKVDGLPVPPCFFKALVRPENTEILTKLLRWTTIPGLWTRADIQKAAWLPNGAAPSLSVTHIDMPRWNATQALRQEAFESRQDLYDSFLQHPHTVREATQPSTPETAQFDPHIVTLVEGKEIVIWDIAFYNGYGHTVSELPLRPDLDLRSILWDCLDSLCYECPIVTKFLLKYLDNGGLLPDVTNPKAYIVPPGVRPDWVCSGAEHWFPPGWEHHDWLKYLETAKTGNARMAHSLAYSGWKRAAIRSADLEDKLHEAEIHLRKIWHLYGDPSNYVLGSREDPNLLIGWLRNRRSLEVKPRICDPKGGKRPGASLDIWEGSENWDDRLSYNPRDSFVAKIDRDRQRKFGMEDLRYVTQWI